MKKLINHVDDVLAQALSGFGAAHGDLVRVHDAPTFVTRAAPTRAGKVALISGGGSGHEPMHAGLVGLGMLDAACPGQVFTSPTPDQMLAAAQAVDSGAGVLFIVKNYEGDAMNFEMASEMYEGSHASVLTNDDVAVEDSTWTTGRRGVAGTVIVEKIVGAAAEAGAELAALQSLGTRVNARTRSMGVALTSCTVPAAGKPTFDLPEDEMEMGVGIHGEPGRRRVKLQAADAIAEEMIAAITGDLASPAGSRDPSSRQRLRRHAVDGALPDVRRRPPPARGQGPEGQPLAGRQLLHLARHGRLLAHRDRARTTSFAACGTPRCIPRRCGGRLHGEGRHMLAVIP